MKNKIILRVYRATDNLSIVISKVNDLKVRAYSKVSPLNINIIQVPNLAVSATKMDKPLKVKCSIIPKDDSFLIFNTINERFVLKNKIYLKVKKDGILLQ